MPRTLQYCGHIPLQKLWAVATLETELTLPEHNHMLFCQACCAALLSCIDAESFEAVFSMLQKDDDVIAEAS